MKRFVVDASVAAQWYFEEPYTAQAELLLADAVELLAPDLLHVEIASLLARRVSRREIPSDEAHRVLAELGQVPCEWSAASQLAPAALGIALRTGLSVPESIYLALALEAHCPLLTADRKLYDALRADRLAPHVAWIADLAPGGGRDGGGLR
ncbi:MAG TPA: type II toxin-antitoxin system VapC family toxin [Thermoanaerobaculia bacterium]|nr:type II toxin-antitoxin system VapC family toxin [Thermoanaerobaculia bacterium]